MTQIRDPGRPTTRRRRRRARPRDPPQLPSTVRRPPRASRAWLAFLDAGEADPVGGGRRLAEKLAGATRSVGPVALIAHFSLLGRHLDLKFECIN